MDLYENDKAVATIDAAAIREERKSQLALQIAELESKRKAFATELGESLYEVVRDDEKLREGREELLDGIAALDEQKAACEKEIADIEAEIAAEAAAAAEAEAARLNAEYVCQRCGTTVHGYDKFCSGCAMPVARIIDAYEGTLTVEEAVAQSPKICPTCGQEVGEADLFCMTCGTKLQ